MARQSLQRCLLQLQHVCVERGGPHCPPRLVCGWERGKGDERRAVQERKRGERTRIDGRKLLEKTEVSGGR